MSTGLYSITTRAAGTVLTAAIYNADHQNHVTNQNPSMTGAYSDNVAQFQIQTNPGGVGTESLSPSLAGELERFRYVLAQIMGTTFWYDYANKNTGLTGILRNYITGMESGAPGGAQVVTIGPGTCADGGNTQIIQQSGTFTKSMAAWAAGSGSGGLDTGLIAASTPYFIWAIKRTDLSASDYLISLSSSTPTMPAGYTFKRLIRWFKTDATPNIWQYQDRGDTTLYGVNVVDINVTETTANRTLRPMTVPIGFVVDALIRGGMSNSGGSAAVVFTSPDEIDETPGTGNSSLSIGNISPTTNIGNGEFQIRTNTSGQIGSRANAASTTVTASTKGFIWTRGRNS